ncbi:PREDICTED: DNA-directed RNA polymerase III subunit RPC8 [Tarenaya hassleriana]|uniref:DNA-directed RNA polymerase III subunit RPC8 n=1 Tax=Tarenaya hassleriana TaxID=28532 RepID=UPI00053C0B23|nr:PREDICTED: DNA-directed RNA polymerase III subunit RPC8 [Tarenaya hassleriana]XP_010542702.1 PREDICTED: DNA-directed RNA polymerase III subunit RPC8 [Tarenaya hassleriana]XP_010542703.1 PREDICTED: DNA-directed RNA polymerase III subunit RPC8 [Tarenaya hassleriana]
MFYLSELEHTLRVPPHLLNLPVEDAIKSVLESIFLDKVVAKLGLCVSVYDIQSIKGGFVFPGDGAASYTVVFRMVVFRPFVGEIIVAKLKESDADGLRLTLGFFEDIYVPSPLLPAPNRFEADPCNRNQMRWVWEYDGQDYVIDDSFKIKFRVENVTYPAVPIERPEQSKPFAPMVITGLIDGDGLGPVSWWDSYDELGGDAEEE